MKPFFVTMALLVSSFTANAANFSFTGQFNHDDDYQFFSFTVGEETDVTIKTLGFAGSAKADGGTNAAGNTILAGGFDPMLIVWDSTGAFIKLNEDCPADLDNDCSDVDSDMFEGLDSQYDALIELEDLVAGQYFFALAQYGNDWSQMPSMQDITFLSGVTNFLGRTGNWAVDVIGDGVVDAAAVPVPAAVWLLGSALMGMFGMAKRKTA